MNKYLITEEKVNILINYLSKKPYSEVYQIIDYLMKLEKEKNENREAVS